MSRRVLFYPIKCSMSRVILNETDLNQTLKRVVMVVSNPWLQYFTRVIYGTNRESQQTVCPIEVKPMGDKSQEFDSSASSNSSSSTEGLTEHTMLAAFPISLFLTAAFSYQPGKHCFIQVLWNRCGSLELSFLINGHI